MKFLLERNIHPISRLLRTKFTSNDGGYNWMCERVSVNSRHLAQNANTWHTGSALSSGAAAPGERPWIPGALPQQNGGGQTGARGGAPPRATAQNSRIRCRILP